MPQYQINIISSLDELKSKSVEWDHLWQQSEVALPTMRAAVLAQWLEHFHPSAPFTALTVEDGNGRIVAALPVMSQRIKGIVKVADLPANEWINTGDLLVADDIIDCTANCDQVMTLLLQAVNQSPWPLFWFDAIKIDAPKWQSFIRCADRIGLKTDIHPRYEVGTITVDQCWQQYEKGLSKSLRRNLKRRDRQLQEQGSVKLVHVDCQSPDFLDQLQLAFEVEDRSWKGPLGTTLLQTPNIYPYFEKQSLQIAKWKQLSLYMLMLDEKPIAFEYGYFSKGTYFAHKVSYDEQYAYFSPGQLLRWYQLKTMFQQTDHHRVDYIGKVTAAVEKWSTDHYRIGRLVLATDRFVGRMLMWSYQTMAPIVRHLRNRKHQAPSESLNSLKS